MKQTLVVLALIAAAAVAYADHDTATLPPDHGLFAPDAIRWLDGPPSLPPGAQFAILEGDPGAAGFFTMRLKIPAGYRIPPHFHKRIEHVTVISGTFNLGMGERFDESKTLRMPAGTFGFLAPDMKHFAFASEPTIIQLHGDGPWGIYYLNPDDDPRNRK